MTISSSSIKIVHSADGVTTEWAFPTGTTFLSNDNVKVVVTDEDEVETEITSNLTISLTERTVTYPTVGDALEAGNTLTIYREVDFSQEFAPGSSPYSGSTLETGMDKLAMQIQDLKEQSDRSFKVKISNVDPVDIDSTVIALEQINEKVGEAQSARDESVSARNESVPAAATATTARDEAVAARDEVIPAWEAVMPAETAVLAARDEVIPAWEAVMPAETAVLAARDEVLAAKESVDISEERCEAFASGFLIDGGGPADVATTVMDAGDPSSF